MFDFDTVYPPAMRRRAGSEKWLMAQQQGFADDVVPLTVADMEFATAPVVVDAVTQAAQSGLWGYTGPTEAYKETVVNWMQTRHNWRPEKEWIVCTSGVVHAVYAAVRAFTKPGDGVLIQPPVYPPFYSGIRQNGRTLLENRLIEKDGRYTIDFDDFERQAQKATMFILCSPHNPAGRVWTKEELTQMAAICHAHDVLFFSDEIHADIVMPNHRHTPYGVLGNEYQQRAIIATSASKTFSLAGLTTSNIFIQNSAMRETFESQLMQDGVGFNSYFGLVATQTAYQSGAPWLEALLRYLHGNYRLAAAFFKEQLPQLTVAPLEGSYLLWVDFSALGLSHEALQEFLKTEAQLPINDGATFGAGGEGHGRINLACPRQTLQNALNRLVAAAQKNGLI